MHLFRSVNRFFTESAQSSHAQRVPKISTQSQKQFSSSTTNKFVRCKLCYRFVHTDTNYKQKVMKRPPTMPEWVSKGEYKKCKTKGHLLFKYPPKYDNKPINIQK